MLKKIIIGTRGSQLSITQTNLVKIQLQQLIPKIVIEIQTITTKGDRDMKPVPLDTVGKGWFTKELDKALLNESIDLAVHSLKDIPEEIPKGLIIAAIPQREDAREAMISRNKVFFEKLKKGAIVGTDSTRRKAQILHKRPDLTVKSLRGNVNRRLEKLERGEYDAIFLAVAGLKRLGLEHKITQYFAETDFVPSPGQGALAIVTKETNTILNSLLKKLNNPELLAAITAERTFSEKVGGGCQMPIGAYAEIKKNKLKLYGMLGSLDGKHVEKLSLTEDSKNAKTLGKKLAGKLLKKCQNWYNTNSSKKYIVVTRPENDEKVFEKKLLEKGYDVFSYPTIKITKNILSAKEKKYFSDLQTYDWLIFTSQHGVTFFIDELKKQKINLKILKQIKIGVVGQKTAEAVNKYKLPVNFIPSKFTTDNLGKELPDINGKKILLARSNIANPKLIKLLKQKKAFLTDLPTYQTKLIKKQNKNFAELIKMNQVGCLTFTSPSTVEGFIKNTNQKLHQAIFNIPVLSIGPVTTKATKKIGFKKIYSAENQTIDAMLTKLQEITL